MELNIDHISCTLGENSFSYHACLNDSITAVFGLSGSGKTTLLNLICGTLRPHTGRLVFNDRVFFDAHKRINLPENKRNVGVVFQENALFPHLSVKQNLLYSRPYIKKRRQRTAFDTVVELLDLAPLLARRPAQLSGGERQRAAIGRTLLAQPELLLMDEPFSNLDKKRRAQIISYLLKINQLFDIPLLIVSHDLEDILRLSRSFLIVDQGRVAASGSYPDIADSGLVPDLIGYRQYINLVDLWHTAWLADENINHFSLKAGTDLPVLRTNSQGFADSRYHGHKARLCIFPDDIALTAAPVSASSFQNQLPGTVTAVRHRENSCFVTIDCGLTLIAEITCASAARMKLQPGAPVWSLIKAKAIEVVHVF